MPTVTITPQLFDQSRCVYHVSERISEGPVARFTCLDNESKASPIAYALLSVPGVEEVEIEANSFTVTKRTDLSWDALDEPIRYAVGTVLGTPGTPTGHAGEDLDDDDMFDAVAEIFEREINPTVAQHGGRVDLIDVQDATVILRMQGGCQGCGMASVTLRQGIEGTLRRELPALNGIQDITDHAAGTNPYFSSEKK